MVKKFQSLHAGLIYVTWLSKCLQNWRSLFIKYSFTSLKILFLHSILGKGWWNGKMLTFIGQKGKKHEVKLFVLIFSMLLFRPTLVREEISTRKSFFVQSILVDRYIHFRGFWALSLESPSSVDYITKNIYLNFVFSTELSRFKFCEHLTDFRLSSPD